MQSRSLGSKNYWGFKKMKKNIFLDLLEGKSLARILMNDKISEISLYGLVVDIGGGLNKGFYDNFKSVKDAKIINLDLKNPSGSPNKIDLEENRLPFQNNSVDCILMFNILEHIFNFKFLLEEVSRSLKTGGTVLGFVPFLINYHPDPNDYFRYTEEALEKIFFSVGFNFVEVAKVGGGPFYVNFNNIVLSMPKIFRPIVFVFYLILDKFFLKLRPKAARRYPLGYFFKLIK